MGQELEKYLRIAERLQSKNLSVEFRRYMDLHPNCEITQNINRGTLRAEGPPGESNAEIDVGRVGEFFNYYIQNHLTPLERELYL